MKKLLLTLALLFCSLPLFAQQHTESRPANPCNTNIVSVQHKFVNITTATTTAILAPSTAGQNYYICGVDFELNSSTASTILFEIGTGVACATGPTAVSATYANAAVPLVFHMGFGGISLFTTGVNVGFCAVTTVGTGPTISVDVAYVLQ